MSRTTELNNKKLKYIDALRGLGILGVICVNSADYGFNEYPAFFASLISEGERGVQLFFLVSAFTLFLSYNRNLARNTASTKQFFARRFFRIAPMYYLGIVYYLWQNGFGPSFWLGNEPAISSWNILSNIFFVHGVNPTWISSIVPGGWSITVEMMFYLLVPLLVDKIRNLNHAVSFTLGTLVFAQILKAIGYAYPLIDSSELWIAYLNLYLPAQLPVFACGIIAYFLIIKKERDLSKLNWLLLSSISLASVIWGKTIPPNIMFGTSFLLLIFVLSKYPIKLVVNPVLQRLGTISYSAYLVHFAVLFWLTRWQLIDFIETGSPVLAILNYCIRLGLVLLLTSIISYVTHKLIEEPFQKIGKLLTRKFLLGEISTPTPTQSEDKVRINY